MLGNYAIYLMILSHPYNIVMRVSVYRLAVPLINYFAERFIINVSSLSLTCGLLNVFIYTYPDEYELEITTLF